jgi:glucose/mannose-6-phosphate isomerase
MGGSALGMDVVRTALAEQLTIPVTIVQDYTVPAWINGKTLAILSSYSGTTEEVLAIAEQIENRTSNIMVMTTGGGLEELVTQKNYPAYIFNPRYNPSNQPRMAVGYSVMGIMGILYTLGKLTIEPSVVASAIATMTTLHERYEIDAPLETNPAKQLATQLVHHVPVLVSSEFLEGSTHVMTNQLNENAKQFASRFMIPELNHHLIEGLKLPKTVLAQHCAVFIQSALYHPRNQARHTITKQLCEQEGLQTTSVTLTGTTKLDHALELLTLGGYTSFYLSILNGLDPSPIPNVDYLKEELAKL